MIIFKEHSSPKYPPRTYENASADATLAFAIDFNTAGERLTKEAVTQQGKLYLAVDINNGFAPQARIDTIAKLLSAHNVKSLNIAGNGIYTLCKYFTQDNVDEIVLNTISRIFDSFLFQSTVELVRSGGQSGADEAGAKAGDILKIPTLVLCPRGWKFTNINRETVCDEILFKQRFNHKT